MQDALRSDGAALRAGIPALAERLGDLTGWDPAEHEAELEGGLEALDERLSGLSSGSALWIVED